MRFGCEIRQIGASFQKKMFEDAMISNFLQQEVLGATKSMPLCFLPGTCRAKLMVRENSLQTDAKFSYNPSA